MGSSNILMYETPRTVIVLHDLVFSLYISTQ